MNHQMLIRKRINWLTTLLFVVLVSVLISACGAEEPKVYRVGILSGTDAFLGIADGFKANMTELGYIEGQNIAYDLQQVNADPAEEQRLAQKFADDKVDLIFAFPTEAALAAKAATQGTDIPVVFAFAGVEGADLVNSVPEPGGNITGVRFPGPDLSVKRFEILHEMAPHIEQVGIIYNANYPANQSQLDELMRAAGMTVSEMTDEKANFPDPTDRASLESDRNFELRIRDRERKLIMKIKETISRLDEGDFGVCESCGEHIGEARLKARPVTTLCIDCKTEQERQEKIG